ncbi:MAG: 1-acyl-sn-glycerol-3-phosphate acyltransferase [Gammaproteobacteria bacterium]|nr:1-acyl-sn-glycerol-3-phosphate acyltransferase [Gammaproteobacteria bacterium]NNF60129.1 1-acyl-sn-glycerol-3-phosphate acyltransferase [Gammaproteobacteria bacterium]NNM21541.1 1-acyl-sn-glycerol-3-phosphate acyltransferase [Gammaproteobacteria bacterium]
MQYLRSLLFTILMSLSVVPYAVWVLLAAPFGRSASYRAAVRWVRLNLWLLRVLCGLDHEVTGAENIPADGTCVVYLKHSSTWETFAELLVFPEQTWVLKRELYWLPLFGWALAALRPVGINRGARSTAVRQVVSRGALRLNAGVWVMIFPEGTRMAPGKTRRYGLSGALLAKNTQRRIIPVAHNACDYWPRHSLLKKPGTIRMVVGPPIETAGREPAAINEEAQAWIEGTMQQISTAYADRSAAADAA